MISQRVLTQPLHLLLLCSRSSNTGKIVGGVVGVVAGLAILAGALVLYFRRCRVLGLGAMQESRVYPYPDTMVEMVEAVATPATGVGATDPGAVGKLLMKEAVPTHVPGRVFWTHLVALNSRYHSDCSCCRRLASHWPAAGPGPRIRLGGRGRREAISPYCRQV